MPIPFLVFPLYLAASLEHEFIPQCLFPGCTPVGKGLRKALFTGSLVELAMALSRHQQQQHHLGAS